jgi:hypothetical protein
MKREDDAVFILLDFVVRPDLIKSVIAKTDAPFFGFGTKVGVAVNDKVFFILLRPSAVGTAMADMC